jgi:hypothetical protein
MLARLSTRAPRAFNAVRFNSSSATRTSRLAEMAASAEKPGTFSHLPCPHPFLSGPATVDPVTLADVRKKLVTNASQALLKSLFRCCGALSPSRLS